MRLLLAISFLIFITACNKDKFTTVPQIKYKSIKPNTAQSNIPFTTQVIPVVTIEVTDAEGDLGFINGSDTSKVYVKNLITNKLDSLTLPDIKSSAVKNFRGELQISMDRFIGASSRPRPKTDTLYFEIYVQDFAKNKSNVIKTGDPLFYITP